MKIVLVSCYYIIQYNNYRVKLTYAIFYYRTLILIQLMT